jgi:hypothetical protein
MAGSCCFLKNKRKVVFLKAPLSVKFIFFNVFFLFERGI